jgi:hypothetical protein
MTYSLCRCRATYFEHLALCDKASQCMSRRDRCWPALCSLRRAGRIACGNGPRASSRCAAGPCPRMRFAQAPTNARSRCSTPHGRPEFQCRTTPSVGQRGQLDPSGDEPASHRCLPASAGHRGPGGTKPDRFDRPEGTALRTATIANHAPAHSDPAGGSRVDDANTAMTTKVVR